VTGRAFDGVNVVGRPAGPDEIAGVINYLALDAPSFLTGATVFVDGGQTTIACMPS
jgi:NAD(P)-dependent dehydrogenase (short-subunit alcohol dehydrogenase family)